MRNQIKLLIDGADTQVLRVPGIFDTYRHAVEFYFAATLLVSSAQDLHQSGFAGAVLAEQHVNLASAQLKVNLIQSQDPWESLADLRHLQKRRSHDRHRVRTASGSDRIIFHFPFIISHLLIVEQGTSQMNRPNGKWQ